MLEHALHYAESGYPVFPCKPNKRPYTSNGFHAATTDPETIKRWWGLWPDAMIGLPTGGRFWVLDVDVRDGKLGRITLDRLQAVNGALPSTKTVRTPSGGFHYYFTGDMRTTTGTLGPGLDTRGTGGYVIAPPSVIPGEGEYALATAAFVTPQPAPMWLLSLFLPSEGMEQDKASTWGADRMYEDGSRNQSLFKRACLLRRHGFTEESIYQAIASENLERCSPPLPEGELKTIAASAARYEPDERALTLELVGKPEDAGSSAVFQSAQALAISRDEWDIAELTPRVIVDSYLYADVGQLIAPGGVGKTTLTLFEAVHFALGRDVWGMSTKEQCATLFITKEDSRERLVARLRQICLSLQLTQDEIDIVRNMVLIEDFTGRQLKFAAVHDGNVVQVGVAEKLIAAYLDDGLRPGVIVVDPAVSFGASENLVNDNEQALVEFGRTVVRDLDCCFRYVHHTGKTNAREQTLDAYSGRGGTAFADGSRMVTVLAAWKDGASNMPMAPSNWALTPEDSLMVMARPKLSYARPNLPKLLLRRTGFAYDYHVEPEIAPSTLDSLADRLWAFIEGEARGAAKKDIVTIAHSKLRATKADIDAAFSVLTVARRVEEEDGRIYAVVKR